MALPRALADSGVSWTATRADGPAPGSRKSMFSVCSACACTGWSKYTLASVSRNQPDGPLPLPLIETFSVREVHMDDSSQSADDYRERPKKDQMPCQASTAASGRQLVLATGT